MGKKKPAEQIPTLETIHFRPGEMLGRIITNAATEHGLSRGEITKRFVALALHGFDVRHYPFVEEITNFYGGPFEQACEVLRSLVEFRTQAAAPSEDVRLKIVREVVQEHRVVHGIEQREER